MATLGEYIGAGLVTTKLLLHLNGNSTDSSGNSNNGTDTAITYSQANGKFGQGAGFNGSSSKIQCTVAGNSVFTVSMWFYNNGSFLNNKYLITRRNTSNNANYGLVTRTTGKIGMNSYNGSTSGGVDSNANLSANTWYNIIAVFNGSSSKLYFNGVADTASQSTIQTHTSGNDTFLGANSTSDFLNGKEDEVIIENTAWSAEKVNKYYTMAKGRFGII